MEPSKIGAVIVLYNFLIFPLIAEPLNPLDQHLNTANVAAEFRSPAILSEEIGLNTINDENESSTELVPESTISHYKYAPMIPKFVEPMKTMVIHTITWPLSSSIESCTGKNNLSFADVTVPSVYCLHSSSDFVKLPEQCKNDVDTWRSFMTDIYSVRFTEFSSNDTMNKRYSTLLSYFAGLDENVKLPTNRMQLMRLGTYWVALELAMPYINLPLIAHYLELNTEVVWLTIKSTDSLNPIIESSRPRDISDKNNILPLVNPRLWHLPVDKENPYSVLIPNLPADDPYAIKIEPLKSILSPGNWFTEAFEENWNPLEHGSRGLLFVNVLYTLEKGISMYEKDERMNHGASGDLGLIVKNYRAAIRSLAFFSHVPPSYIENIPPEGLSLGL